MHGNVKIKFYSRCETNLLIELKNDWRCDFKLNWEDGSIKTATLLGGVWGIIVSVRLLEPEHLKKKKKNQRAK